MEYLYGIVIAANCAVNEVCAGAGGGAARRRGAMTPVLYARAVCSRSLTLFLRHHNLRYLWSVFSMSPLYYFLPKGTTLVNAARGAHSCSLCPMRARRVGRTYWLSSTVSINCTCVRRVVQIKETEHRVLSTKGLNKFEYVLICSLPSLISSSALFDAESSIHCLFRRTVPRTGIDLLKFHYLLWICTVYCDVRSFVVKIITVRSAGIVCQVSFKILLSVRESLVYFYNQETIENRGLTSNYVLSIRVVVCGAGRVSIKSQKWYRNMALWIFTCVESRRAPRTRASPAGRGQNKRESGGRFNSLPLEAIIRR